MNVLLTVAEAAAELRLGVTKTKEYISCGEIASIKLGRRRLVPRAAVEAFIQQRLQSAAGAGAEAQP